MLLFIYVYDVLLYFKVFFIMIVFSVFLLVVYSQVGINFLSGLYRMYVCWLYVSLIYYG